MHQQEFDLFCQVLAEDSMWLDSYQSSILQDPCKTIKKVQMIHDDPDQASDGSSRELLGVEPTRHEITVDEPHIIENLSAGEFVCGTRSFVAAESLRLMKRAMASSLKSRKTICFKTNKSFAP